MFEIAIGHLAIFCQWQNHSKKTMVQSKEKRVKKKKTKETSKGKLPMKKKRKEEPKKKKQMVKNNQRKHQSVNSEKKE